VFRLGLTLVDDVGLQRAAQRVVLRQHGCLRPLAEAQRDKMGTLLYGIAPLANLH
jgi:hypothetical protein